MFTRSLPPRSSRLSALTARFFAFSFSLLLAVVPAVALAKGAAVKFDIPAQPAASALQAFAKQAGMEVLFPFDELKKVQAQEVKGELEPADALKRLLDGTGYEARQTAARNFVVRKAETATTGSVKGSLVGEGGKSLPDVLVTIRETAQSASTDKYGQYVFPKVAAGTYVLVATTAGYQPMHITDVVVRAGNELMLGKETMRPAAGDVTALEPLIVHADAVTQLETIEVTGSKGKPFEGANVDLPRTINDVQPYYIFDSKTLDTSGATNVEDFLKQRLTMNAQALAFSQTANSVQASVSQINLRGLGADKTLILINGRRVSNAGVFAQNADLQPDLNGIPLAAIDRIEVMPSSASGIYGGSAIGGVINVILKKDYTGGELRATYDNTWDTDAPKRSVSASYGLALEGGKTHVMLSAAWSDSVPLLLQDRRQFMDEGIARVLQNQPSLLYTSTSPFLGSLPNITANSTTQTTLTLKNGVVIPSSRTFIAAGTSPTTPAATLNATLAANGGAWNFDLPYSTQAPTGLLRPLAPAPQTKSFQASVRRQMSPWLELFTDFSYADNRTESFVNQQNAAIVVPANSVINPFTTAVAVRFPDASVMPFTTTSNTHSVAAGAILHLPRNWTAEADFSWSKNRDTYHFATFDITAQNADILSGTFNPFVDTLLYPLNLHQYDAFSNYSGAQDLNDIALRGSGPLPALPWGQPNLTFGLEHRRNASEDAHFSTTQPISVTKSFTQTYYGRKQVTDSAYSELTLPLVKRDWRPLLHALELQVAGRAEKFAVGTGTTFTATTNTTPPTISYNGILNNGAPYFSQAHYSSVNGTVGLKYQPVPELTLRASIATAFLPPTPTQLQKNLVPSTTTTPVNDPKNNNASFAVQTLSGGNPDLTPQTSRSLNAGIIWEPRWPLLRGLRLDAEYYRIRQANAIGSLTAQQIVNLESLYPDRVTRDANGIITLVDISSVNLLKRETEGWDLTGDYTLKTGAGTFNLNAMESIVLHIKNQASFTVPLLDAVNYPAELGAVKYKSNATLSWDLHGWNAGWTTRFYSSYRQSGAPGGPSSIQFANGGISGTNVAAQGSESIPSQIYHDLFASYAFGTRKSTTDSRLSNVGNKFISGLTVQIGVRNIFNAEPPFDVFYMNTNNFRSPYGDLRLRSYWLSIRKAL